MSVRLKRLQADYKKVSQLSRRNGTIEIKSASGNPPEKYQIEYHIRGLEQKGNRIVTKGHHLVEIILPFGYPREAPQCRMLTPVFHPNIAPHAICIGDHWAAGESLADLIIRIGEMICYQSYNVKSPLNGEAARWADENIKRLPIDSSDLSQIARKDDDLVSLSNALDPETPTAGGQISDHEEKDTLYEIDSDPGLELIVTQDDPTKPRPDNMDEFEEEAHPSGTELRIEKEESIEEEVPLEDRVRISYHDTSSEKITNIITSEKHMKTTLKHREETRYCWRCGYIVPAAGTQTCVKCGHDNRQ